MVYESITAVAPDVLPVIVSPDFSAPAAKVPTIFANCRIFLVDSVFLKVPVAPEVPPVTVSSRRKSATEKSVQRKFVKGLRVVGEV